MVGTGRTLRGLVFGGTGMLGSDVVRDIRRRGGTALGVSHRQGDITDPDRVDHWLESFRPEVVFNCAALTRVDDCEEEEELALEVNGEAVGHLAESAERVGARLVHVSSDYVFDGEGEVPYREDHPTGPLSVYGASKLEGERRALATDGALVVRSSWLFGPGGGNFVATMLRLIDGGHETLRVVDDQRGAPTYTPYLARAMVDLVLAGAQGVVHYQNREAVTWYGFTREIVAQYRPSVEVIPVATEEFPRPAPRPAYSVLDVDRVTRILGRPVEQWRWGLYEYLKERRRDHPRSTG